MLMGVLSFGLMADEKNKRMTIDIPADLHDAFFLKCFQNKPRVTMKQRLIELISKELGRPAPKFVDRRKLKKGEREAEAKAKG
jgi:hypothetical protein